MLAAIVVIFLIWALTAKGDSPSDKQHFGCIDTNTDNNDVTE